jgi:hypothetical protein
MLAMSETVDLPLFSSPEPPTTFGELERALEIRFDDDDAGRKITLGHFRAPPYAGGHDEKPLSAQVDSVSAKCRWDMHHEDSITCMDELRWRSLQKFSVDFLSGWTACESLLRSRYGAPRTADNRLELPDGRVLTSSYMVYGPFFVSPHRDGVGFHLSWYAKCPDWALPRINVDARRRYLLDLARTLETCEAHADVVAAASSPPSGAGIIATGPLNRNDYWLELSPAMLAAELVSLWAWDGAIGESRGVHMDSWLITRISERNELGITTSVPMFGSWIIEATLERWPRGGDVEGAYVGPTGYGHFAEGDTVRHLRIAPARDR